MVITRSEEPASGCGRYAVDNLLEHKSLYGTYGNRTPAVCPGIELLSQPPPTIGRGRIPIVPRTKRLALHSAEGSVPSQYEPPRALRHLGLASARCEGL